MGGVFAAEDGELGARVAVKVMLPHLADNTEFVARFMREAKATASLSTPYVARVYDVGRTEAGAPFMVMELLEGQDLDKILRARGPLPIAEAVGYILEACHAIAEAHAHGIIHRDLKPSNLFVAGAGGPRPVVKLLDFGISKLTKIEGASDGLTETDSTLGSPQYMSPEQVRSAKRVDHRTDLWSLGIILHKLLTARLAFEAESIGAHLVMINTEPPTPLRANRPDAPAALEQVIQRCLQKDTALRFQNVGQLAVALAPFVAPNTRPLIDAIVATCGRDASLAPLPPLGAGIAPADAPTRVASPAMPPAPPAAMHGAHYDVAPIADVGTAPGWAPAHAPAPPRHRGLLVAALIGAIGIGGALALVNARRRASTPDASPAAQGPTEADARASAGAVAPSSPATASAPAEPVAAPAGGARVTLDLDPKDAEIELDGAVVHDNPLVVPRGTRPHRLVVRAPGYVPDSRELSPDADTTLHVHLRKAAGRRKLDLETNL
jgi:serine/threonine-protein kinase